MTSRPTMESASWFICLLMTMVVTNCFIGLGCVDGSPLKGTASVNMASLSDEVTTTTDTMVESRDTPLTASKEETASGDTQLTGTNLETVTGHTPFTGSKDETVTRGPEQTIRGDFSNNSSRIMTQSAPGITLSSADTAELSNSTSSIEDLDSVFTSSPNSTEILTSMKPIPTKSSSLTISEEEEPLPTLPDNRSETDDTNAWESTISSFEPVSQQSTTTQEEKNNTDEETNVTDEDLYTTTESDTGQSNSSGIYSSVQPSATNDSMPFNATSPSEEPCELSCPTGKCIHADQLPVVNGSECWDNRKEQKTFIKKHCVKNYKMFSCDDYTTCLNINVLCDLKNDCEDLSDEMYCMHDIDAFVCDNGKLIQRRYQCDSSDDCGDNSDEENCVREEIVCPEFVCNTTTVSSIIRNCLPFSRVCDRTADCEDGSDESDCYCHTRCDMTRCLTTAQLCDGEADCHDGRDEEKCYFLFGISYGLIIFSVIGGCLALGFIIVMGAFFNSQVSYQRQRRFEKVEAVTAL